MNDTTNYKEKNDVLPVGRHTAKVFWSAPKVDKRGNAELRIGFSTDQGVAWKSLQMDGFTTDRQQKYVAAQVGNLLKHCTNVDIEVTHQEFNGKTQTNVNVLPPEEKGQKQGAVEQFGQAFQAEEIPF